MTNDESKVLNTILTNYSCIYQPSQPQAPFTSLWIFGERAEDEQESRSPTSLLFVDDNDVKLKIACALKGITFREERVFVQFWSSFWIRKHCLLMNLDQPFGLGMLDERLLSYRMESEKHVFVVDVDYTEKEIGSPGFVYQQKLAECCFDIDGLSARKYTQHWAACYNFQGYLVLPIFEPTTGCCVGVLEFITSSSYTDFSFEVQEISKALKKVNLESPNTFQDPCSSMRCPFVDERRQHELNQIFCVLKGICDFSRLHLAQTWALTGNSSYVVTVSGDLVQSCNSFNKSCIGKVCMSTADLPFHVRDLGMWQFREACRERHLEKSVGCVGKAFSTRGSCFCKDITTLSEEEYPLVHNERMSGLTSCLAIFLHSVEGQADYVLEFILPLDIKDDKYIPTLMRTLKQKIEDASRFELGDISSVEVIGPQREISSLCLNAELDTSIQICSRSEMDPQPIVANVSTTDEGEPSNRLRHGIKRKIDSLTLDTVQEQFGRPMDKACEILGVSRSTLKRFCREHCIPKWPSSSRCKKPPDRIEASDSNMELLMSDAVHATSTQTPYSPDRSEKNASDRESFWSDMEDTTISDSYSNVDINMLLPDQDCLWSDMDPLFLRFNEGRDLWTV